MSYDTIIVDEIEGVQVIRLNRPDRLNAWTYHMGSEMRAAVEAANANPDITAIILTGEGRGFCAGADVEDVFKAQSEGEEVSRDGGGMGDWVSLIRSSKPAIAAINGAAIGLGVTQVLPMDYLIASDNAKISVRFVKMGLVPELASSHFLAARVGFGRASELMLTGRTVVGEEALACGLVDEVCAGDELMDRALTMAKAMGENPQSALRQIKQLLTDNIVETDLKAVQKREGQALAVCYASAEHREAIDAFLNKREPDFAAARRAEEA